MNNGFYTIFALILGIASWFTGELVTFIMLGIILIALININSTLKKISLQNEEKSNKTSN